MRMFMLVPGVFIFILGGFFELVVLAEVLFGMEISGGSGRQWRLGWDAAILPGIITAIGIALIVLGLKVKAKIETMRDDRSISHFH